MTMTASRHRATPTQAVGAPSEETTAPRHPVLRGVVSGVVTVLLVALVALALALAVVPRALGGASLTVLSGSMEPTYSPGDVVVPVPQDSYAVGDVVTFQPTPGDPTLITHRVTRVLYGADGASYITRGDANGADDDPIVADQIMGKVRYSVPYIGYVTNAAGGRNVLIVSVVGVGLLAYGAYLFGSGWGEQRRRRAASAGASSSTGSTDPATPASRAASPEDKDAR